MAIFRSSTNDRQDRRPHTMRWIALLLASLLLHLVVFNWANGRLGIPALQEKSPEVITTTLLTPPPVKPAPAPVAPPPKVVKPKRHRPAPPPPPAEIPVASPPEGMEVPGTSVDPAVELAGSAANANQSANAGNDAAGNAGAASEPAETAQTTPAFKTNPPPPAELKYDVRALIKGQNWYGSGLFKWNTDGSRYSISAEAGVTVLIRITALNISSEGVVQEFGLAPVLYTEKPWRKAVVNTHFQQEKKIISFSASTASYPYEGGEQDRASIAWQLASIGRGNPDQFTPGATFDIKVAGTRNMDVWHIQVVGLEEVQAGDEVTAAWHAVRTPRPDSHDQKLDFWFAPQKDWYPVRLRYTYENGDYYDLTLTELTPLATQPMTAQQEPR